MATPDHGELDDRRLLKLAIGDPDPEIRRQAASDLLARYQDRIYAWCFRMVGDHDRALDLAQEALITAYRDLASFRGEARFSTWIFTVTRRRCLSALRRPSLLLDDDGGAMDPADPKGAPDRLLEERLDEERLLELIQDCLDPLEQEALWLRCYEKVPVDEITRMLGLTESSGARGILQRARRRLRATLRESADAYRKGPP